MLLLVDSALLELTAKFIGVPLQTVFALAVI